MTEEASDGGSTSTDSAFLFEVEARKTVGALINGDKRYSMSSMGSIESIDDNDLSANLNAAAGPGPGGPNLLNPTGPGLNATGQKIQSVNSEPSSELQQ